MKAASGSVKPAEMIRSLQSVRNQHTTHLLTSSGNENLNTDVSLDFETASVVTSLQRKLNPEKQALNPLELVPLVNEDILAKQTEIDLENAEASERIT